MYLRFYLVKKKKERPRCVSRFREAAWLAAGAVSGADPVATASRGLRAAVAASALPLHVRGAEHGRAACRLWSAGLPRLEGGAARVPLPVPPAPSAVLVPECHRPSHGHSCDRHLQCLPLSLIVLFPFFLLFLGSSWASPTHLSSSSGIPCRERGQD